MKKLAIISGLLLSCFMAPNAEASQPVKEQTKVAQAERRFFLSFLADMRHPDDDRVHWSDNRFENPRHDGKKQAEWNDTYELTPRQAQIIVDRMSKQLFLYREQKRQIYMILTEMHEPMYHYKGHGKQKQTEYVKYMKLKRREMDKKICNVLTQKQREIYFTMKTDTAEYAARIK